jgi:hypothetical protein
VESDIRRYVDTMSPQNCFGVRKQLLLEAFIGPRLGQELGPYALKTGIIDVKRHGRNFSFLYASCCSTPSNCEEPI